MPQFHIRLLSNAGIAVSCGDIKILIDGLYKSEELPFPDLPEQTEQLLMEGLPPLDAFDYVLVTHGHPDHFSSLQLRKFLRKNKIKGVVIPQSLSCAVTLLPYLKLSGVHTDVVPAGEKGFTLQLSGECTLRAYCGRHLDKMFCDVENCSYELECGGRKILFTADADYMEDFFAVPSSYTYDAMFVNPVFFHALSSGRFADVLPSAENVIVYHMPSRNRDPYGYFDMAEKDIEKCRRNGHKALILAESMEEICI